MGELISRQAAIDVLDVLCQEHRYKIPGKGETYSQYNEAWQDALDRAEGAIFNLPSAQPERTPMQELLDVTADRDYWKAQCHSYEMTINRLTESAQPEIVRCKNCKYWIPYDWMFSEIWQSRNIADYSEDEIGCKFCDMTMKADDFCSRAERREDV